MVLAEHSFPVHWRTGEYNRKILDYLDEDSVTVLDCTWLNNTAYDLSCDHLLLVSNVDPHSFFDYSIINGYDYKQIKWLNQVDVPDFNFWGYYCGETFSCYRGQDFPLRLTEQTRFLSYNRKPSKYRYNLVKQFKHNDIFDKGVVTLGHAVSSTYFNGNMITIPENDQVVNCSSKREEFGIPNDVSSLGDMDIWNSCFLNVISETVTIDWISEKTFKPIIGKRPFAAFYDSLTTLQSWGFKTFDKYWDEFLDPIEVVKYLCSLPLHELKVMYRDMQPILEHNHNHFFNEYQTYNWQQLEAFKAAPFMPA